MKYSEPLQTQLYVVLVFLGVGFLLGAWYTVCAFLRRLCGNTTAVTIVLDLLFWLGSFFLLFASFLGFTNGMWRLPALGSAAVGFLLCRRTAGRWLQKTLYRAADFLRGFVKAVFRPIERCSKKLRSFASRMIGSAKAKWQTKHKAYVQKRETKKQHNEKNKTKKEKNNAKALAKRESILYNNLD